MRKSSSFRELPPMMAEGSTGHENTAHFGLLFAAVVHMVDLCTGLFPTRFADPARLRSGA
jgi:hypothetical protein